MLQAEVQWQADRANLRRQQHEHPEWSRSQLAQSLQRSLSWVKKWLKRLREAPTTDPNSLFSRSSRPNHTRTASPPDPVIVERILDIRDHPPDDLKRTPGPKTIAYFLAKDPVLTEQQLKPPTSTSFIWKILTKNQRIQKPKTPKAHQPLTRPAPMSCWQVDFKDIACEKLLVFVIAGSN
jgi:hypothetical protein